MCHRRVGWDATHLLVDGLEHAVVVIPLPALVLHHQAMASRIANGKDLNCNHLCMPPHVTQFASRAAY
jgi:hypothetical protein